MNSFDKIRKNGKAVGLAGMIGASALLSGCATGNLRNDALGNWFGDTLGGMLVAEAGKSEVNVNVNNERQKSYQQIPPKFGENILVKINGEEGTLTRDEYRKVYNSLLAKEDTSYIGKIDIDDVYVESPKKRITISDHKWRTIQIDYIPLSEWNRK